jgi:hypothetical protein
MHNTNHKPDDSLISAQLRHLRQQQRQNIVRLLHANNGSSSSVLPTHERRIIDGDNDSHSDDHHHGVTIMQNNHSEQQRYNIILSSDQGRCRPGMNRQRLISILNEAIALTDELCPNDKHIPSQDETSKMEGTMK